MLFNLYSFKTQALFLVEPMFAMVLRSPMIIVGFCIQVNLSYRNASNALEIYNYRTRVRSLGMLVTNSLTDSLTAV